LVLRVCNEDPLFSLGVLFLKELFKTSSVVRPWLKEEFIVKVKRSIDTRNKSFMCYVQTV